MRAAGFLSFAHHLKIADISPLGLVNEVAETGQAYERALALAREIRPKVRTKLRQHTSYHSSLTTLF